MKTNGWSLAGWMSAALLVSTLFPQQVTGMSVTLRSPVDPVPPGGILVYTIRVNDEEGGTGAATGCFNPPSQCAESTGPCTPTAPNCVGNSFTGFVCVNAANDGADCGVGDPPVPDINLCAPNSAGACAFVCVNAFNEGAYCGSGNPPVADSTLCINNVTGICASGPNLGQPCTAPHGQSTPECPDEGGSGSSEILVTLPIPPWTTLLNADNNAISDENGCTWTLPPLDPCGISGTPQCPLLTAQLIVDPLTPIGTVIENQAEVVFPGGSAVSRIEKTTVGTFNLKKFTLVYPNKDGRDRLGYRGIFTLNTGTSQVIDPGSEAFRIQVLDTDDPANPVSVLDLALNPGELQQTAASKFKFKTREPGLGKIILRERGPGHYSLTLRARKMTLPKPAGKDATVILTFGDDDLSQAVTLIIKRDGRKFVALK